MWRKIKSLSSETIHECNNWVGFWTKYDFIFERFTFSFYFINFINGSYFIVIVAEDVVENVTTVVHGILYDNEIPFPLENPNACLNGISCPLKKGITQKYVQSLPVKLYYPPVS